MKHCTRFTSALTSALFLLLALAAAPSARAQTPVASVTQLTGWVMAVKPDGKIKALATGSKFDVGDTLITEKDSFARVALGDGSETVVGPQTTLKVQRRSDQGMALSLAAGLLQVTPAAGRLTVEAGGTTIAGNGTFIVSYVPDGNPALAAAQLRYLHASVAAAAPSVLSDAGSGMHLEEIVAQILPPPSKPGSLPAGLYVSVIDGIINLSNKGGTQSFSAGQFGYTASPLRPPVIVPPNPGIQFTPPSAFSVPTASNASASGSKAAAVDCIVR